MDADEDARTLFRRAMHGVKPIKRPDRVAPARRRPAPVARSRRARAGAYGESVDGALEERDDGDVAFRRAGTDAGTLRRLRGGRWPVSDEIDLHGLTRAEAQDALADFIAESTALGRRCVRVVHGKGSRSGPDGPVLRHAVHEWLARCDDVLAFASADRRHGGTGAVRVLLRRR